MAPERREVQAPCKWVLVWSLLTEKGHHLVENGSDKHLPLPAIMVREESKVTEVLRWDKGPVPCLAEDTWYSGKST